MRYMTLRNDLARLFDQSHHDTWTTFEWVRTNASRYGLSPAKTAKWRTPGEPAFVSNLLEFPRTRRRLANIIEKHLKPLGLSGTEPLVSGVFIHQKPKVKFRPYRGQVELGDLLLVRQHFSSAVAAPQNRAFLVQAKSCGAPFTGSLGGKEAQQFALYADWSTPFAFPHKELGNPPDGSKYWNFKLGPASYTNCGVYGIVANTSSVPAHFPDRCPWAIGFAVTPTSGVAPSVDASKLSLAEVMEGFVLGRWGRPWDSTPAACDHWSSFVIECLRAASSWRPYPVQRSGHTGASALPRRRDVIGLVHALASPGLARSNYSPFHYNFEYEHDLFEQASRAKAVTGAWVSSLGNPGGDGGGVEDVAIDKPARGLSVLYVATFGDGTLYDCMHQPEP